MAELTPENTADILAACQNGAAEAAEALGRALDRTLQLEIGESATWNTDQAPEGFEGPGLVVVLDCGESAALVILPETSQLLPEWYVEPDPTGQSKLDTLAQDLGKLLLPESLKPERFEAGHVADLRQALKDAGLSAEPGWIKLRLASEDQNSVAHLLWPAANSAALFAATGEIISEESASEPQSTMAENEEDSANAGEGAPAASASSGGRPGTSLDRLPAYTRSLLRVRVAVTATLASKKESLGEILKISPGAILQFEKSCEELLDLEIGGQKCAEGEAVKVGDKFGLRITSIVLPSERFASITTGRAKNVPSGKAAG